MTNSKRQNLPGGLWVVATPIGNLADLSARARQALEEAHGILCEDTRRSAELLAALDIPAHGRLTRFDEQVARSEKGLAQALARLEGGESLALVTDAGTPAVSDPGAGLVARARAQGIQVTPIPGPSAVLALLQASGLEGAHFSFYGFFPRKNADQGEALNRAAAAGGIALWFESPERIEAALEAVAKACPDSRVVAAKELTKIHERFFSSADAAGTLEAVKAEIAAQGKRGEWCFAVEFAEAAPTEAVESSDWVKTLECLISAEIQPSEAARIVSQRFGAPRNDVYARALTISGKKTPGGG